MREADPVLRHVIDRWGPIRLRKDGHYLRALVKSLIYQQLSGRAAATIYARFASIYDGRFPGPQQILATPESRLRAAGLSRQKISYLRDLAQRVLEGTVRLERLDEMNDEQVIAVLTRVRGIGLWSAQMFLIFSLGRPDVLPVGDLGLRKAIQKLYGCKALPAPRTMERLAKPWQPYRSLATLYLWRSLGEPDPNL